MNLQFIEARDLGDAWFQTLYRILDQGTVFKIDRGSYEGQRRLQFSYATIQIKNPGTRPLLPQIEPHYGLPNPVSDDYLDSYLPYLMTGELKPGESYTYGSRMCKVPVEWIWLSYHRDRFKDILIQDKEVWSNTSIISEDSEQFFLNQVELLIWTYKNKGYRNNQMILQVGQPTDMLLQDAPCLRHVDTKIEDGKLHFFPYFRSWDLYSGFPANLAGLQLMKEYIASEIGVEDGEIIATSKGLHIYDYAFDLAKVLRMKEDMVLKEEK